MEDDIKALALDVILGHIPDTIVLALGSPGVLNLVVLVAELIVGDAVVMKAEGSDFVPLDPDELKLIVAWCAQICAGEDTREIVKEDEE